MSTSAYSDIYAESRCVERKTSRDSRIMYFVYFLVLAVIALLLR